ncbi:hypothetical protein ACTFIR_012766, partial [Dictyostelium discoideum]
NQKWVKNWQ